MSVMTATTDRVRRTGAATDLRRRRRRRRSRELWLPVLFLLPALVVLVGLRIWPLIESVRLSLTNWDGISSPKYVGLANYRKLWSDPHFRQALLTNGKLLLALPLFVGLPLVVAAVLQSRVPGWPFFRSVFFFPALLSPAVIALAFQMLLKQDGAFNAVLRGAGLGSWTRVWLADPNWALIWVIIIAAWGQVGIGVVVFLAAMGAVDPELIDAARIDGASWFGVQRHVVFRQILPVIELWTVLVLIGVFTSFFPLILLTTNGGPDYATTTADLYSYQQAFTNYRSGYASAAAVVIFVITVALIGVLLALFSKRRRAS